MLLTAVLFLARTLGVCDGEIRAVVFGHCSFSTAQVQAVLRLLVECVKNPPVIEPDRAMVIQPAVLKN